MRIPLSRSEPLRDDALVTAAPERAAPSSKMASAGVVATAACEHALLLGLVAAYIAGRLIVAPSVLPVDPNVVVQVALFFGIFTLLGLPIRVLVQAATDRRGATEEGTLRRWSRIARQVATGERVVGAALLWLAVSLLYAGYLQWKAGIGSAVPFTWDAQLADIDAGLHLGVDPWRLLTPLASMPALTWAVDFTYHKVWGFVILALPGIMAWSGDALERRRFFLVFALAWIGLGTIGAYLLASAGPVYFAQVADGSARFEPLLTQLAAVHAVMPLTAVASAEFLWTSFDAASWPRVGISAMPSMHLAMATLATLTLWRRGAPARVAGILFLCVMLAGSVHLGWHYAIDGYLSIAAVTLMWWGCGSWLRSKSARA